MYNRRNLRPAALAVALAGCLASVAQAQSANGSIFGRVTAAPGTTIVVHNPDTGTTRTLPVDGNGSYRAADLPDGRYRVSLQRDGVEVGVREEVAVGTAGGTEVSFAGEEPAAPPPADAGARIAELDRIMVTGSRIARAGFDTLEPAAVVSREFIEDYGYTNLADVLFDVPSFGAGASYLGAQASFGAGVNFLSRFGLGSNRMLTLVNGRRFVTSNPPTIFGPANGGIQVDLNAIPSIMVERVESIGIGGAPTYGSDAISGVSNVILRNDFEGAEVELGFGRTSKGDNDRHNWSAILGSNFAQDRGNVTIALSYDNNDGVYSLERDFYRKGYSLQTNPLQSTIDRFQPGRDAASDGRIDPGIPFNTGNNDGIPNSVYIRDRRINNMTWGGLVVPSSVMVTRNYYRDASGQPLGFGADNVLYHFDASGNLLPFDPGTTFGTGASSSGGDGMDLNETTQLISDLKRKSAYANGRFDFTDQVRGFFEASWFRSEAEELADQNVYNASSFGAAFADGSGAQSGNLPFNVDNPFLSEQARALLQAQGITDFRLSRSSRDLSMNNSSSRSIITRAVAGLDGYFEWAGRGFNWETSLTHGRGDFDYYGTGIVQQNFINAINVTRNAAGEIVCDATAAGTTADPDCRPLNLFGEGVASAEALAYVNTPTHAKAEMRQTVFNANLSGGLFDLPGGEFAFNVGFEYRKEEGAFEPSEYQRLGLGRSVPIQAASGDFSTNEYFAEFIAPLVDPDRRIPGLHRLDLTGKVRRVDNTVNGWFTAYTYGLQYEPFAGIQLRGNRTESFRAPSISELYTSEQPAYFAIPELCSATNIDGGTRPAVRRRNCEAFFAAYPGVDPATFTASPSTQLGTRNGSTSLANEQARSWTAGVVLQPQWLDGLRVAADWYDIEITDVITALSPTDIVSGCFDNEDFNAADIANANRFCSMISRNPLTGVANGIATEYGNGPIMAFRGWTGEVNYRWDLRRFGRLDLGFYGYFPKELGSASAPGVPIVEQVGTTSAPKRQYRWSARYQLGKWNVGVNADYQSSALVSLTAIADARQYPRADSYTTWDANVGYRISDRARINLSVINLTDDIGPFPFVYDALGRRYMLKASYRF